LCTIAVLHATNLRGTDEDTMWVTTKERGRSATHGERSRARPRTSRAANAQRLGVRMTANSELAAQLCGMDGIELVPRLL
jgi:hypothetical protein